MSQNRAALIVSIVLIFAAQQLTAQFSAVHVAANMRRYVDRCPTTIIFTGSIDFVYPHPRGGFVFNYQWVRSDGAKGPVVVVRPQPNQGSTVVRDTWTLGRAGMRYNAWERLLVNSGNTHISQSSPTVRSSAADLTAP